MSDSAAPEGDPIAVVAIFGAHLMLCDRECGPGLSEEALAESVRLGLARRYGDRVQVEYHDLRDPAVAREYDDLLATARRLGVPLPFVAVDGAIIQGGGIDFRVIRDAVDVKLETAS